YSPLDLIVEKEKPRSNHLPRINGYLHGLYYTLYPYAKEVSFDSVIHSIAKLISKFYENDH
ncbi:MAG: hypothetical protein E7E38_19805, partial [Enterococcus avium]|nr:hypothetical protein [Enterococcus avium]MDU6622301.1 hypothetical protein [Enterococcus avium]